MVNSKTTITAFNQYTKAGRLYSLDKGAVVCCLACAHRCRIREGKSGVCGVRFNEKGVLMVPSGYITALMADPIEKKPLYHVFPGSKVLSFGMLGCNFSCKFCQNWDISQLEDNSSGRNISEITVKEICDLADSSKVTGFASTYNEPLITSEWAVEIFKEVKKRNSKAYCCFISNGYATQDAIEYIQPWVDAYKVDLKSFKEETYKKLGGNRNAVLETIKSLVERKFWVEVVTLIVPEMNDSEEELKQIAEFIASLSLEIPWHITAFHPAYRWSGQSTPVSTIETAYAIGKKAGLHFIYPGNVGGMGEKEHTWCSGCGALLIERQDFSVISNNLKEGRCVDCGVLLPGMY